MKLEDKIVVITGGSKGLGKALATRFLKDGAKVVVCSRDENRPEDLEENIFWIKADVTKEDELQNLAEKVVAKFGKLDIWINNAGVLYRFPKGELINMEKAHQMFDVNFFGTVFGCRNAIKYMSHDNKSMIVNIISTAGLDATRAVDHKLYASSKWAVRGFLQAFQFENIDSKIKFISVYPGGMQTNLFNEEKPENYKNYMDPNEVANKIIENLKKEIPEEELIIKR